MGKGSDLRRNLGLESGLAIRGHGVQQRRNPRQRLHRLVVLALHRHAGGPVAQLAQVIDLFDQPLRQRGIDPGLQFGKAGLPFGPGPVLHSIAGLRLRPWFGQGLEDIAQLFQQRHRRLDLAAPDLAVDLVQRRQKLHAGAVIGPGLDTGAGGGGKLGQLLQLRIDRQRRWCSGGLPRQHPDRRLQPVGPRRRPFQIIALDQVDQLLERPGDLGLRLGGAGR